jgi:hypothetical protein
LRKEKAKDGLVGDLVTLKRPSAPHCTL